MNLIEYKICHLLQGQACTTVSSIETKNTMTAFNRNLFTLTSVGGFTLSCYMFIMSLKYVVNFVANYIHGFGNYKNA